MTVPCLLMHGSADSLVRAEDAGLAPGCGQGLPGEQKAVGGAQTPGGK